MNRIWSGLGRTIYFILYPILFVYLRINARTRVIIQKDKQILLVKPWLGSGEWDLPGGGLHFSESEVDGAIRETLEETGIELSPDILNPLENFRGKGFLSYSLHIYSCKIAKEPKLKKQFIEIIDIRWVDVSELGDIVLDIWPSFASTSGNPAHKMLYYAGFAMYCLVVLT